MRGTARSALRSGACTGITPACAGNSRFVRLCSASAGDHPRVCGEQFSYGAANTRRQGSPPRVRGTAPRTYWAYDKNRITPACAGNSWGRGGRRGGRGDHPRVCGEQPIRKNLPTSRIGSPPRVRGTDSEKGWAYISRRITPACAGNRDRQIRAITAEEDHPRVCGEQGLVLIVAAACVGSPPRVRGTAIFAFCKHHRYRITPACAGNSFFNCRIMVQIEDHPRVCGEQGFGLARGGYVRGSPPRVRGTGEIVVQHRPRERITPACAGNSMPKVMRGEH